MAKLPPIATRSLPPQRETGFLAGLVGFFMGATGSFLLFLAIAATCGGVLYSMQAAKTQSAAQAYAPQTYASSETPLAPANPSRRRWSRVVMRATSMLLVASAIVGLSGAAPLPAGLRKSLLAAAFLLAAFAAAVGAALAKLPGETVPGLALAGGGAAAGILAGLCRWGFGGRAEGAMRPAMAAIGLGGMAASVAAMLAH